MLDAVRDVGGAAGDTFLEFKTNDVSTRNIHRGLIRAQMVFAVMRLCGGRGGSRGGIRGIQRFGEQEGRKAWAREPERTRPVRQARHRESTLSGKPSENTCPSRKRDRSAGSNVVDQPRRGERSGHRIHPSCRQEPPQ